MWARGIESWASCCISVRISMVYVLDFGSTLAFRRLVVLLNRFELPCRGNIYLLNLSTKLPINVACLWHAIFSSPNPLRLPKPVCVEDNLYDTLPACNMGKYRERLCESGLGTIWWVNGIKLTYYCICHINSCILDL